MWLNITFPPIIIGSLVGMSKFLRDPISDQLLAQMPVDADKVPFLAMMVMILLAFFANLVVIFYIAIFRKGGYDNNHPREEQAKFLQNHGFAARMKAAHNNTNENLPALAAGIFTAISLGLDKVLTAKMCIFYMINRIIFVVTYGLNLDLVRTVVYVMGFFTVLMMMAMSIFPEFNLHTEVDNLLAALPVKIEL